MSFINFLRALFSKGSEPSERIQPILKDDKLWKAYKVFNPLFGIWKTTFLENREENITEKYRVCYGLFLIGAVDALCQSINLSDQQFLYLLDGIASELKLSTDETTRLFRFHQTLNTNHPTYELIKLGGESFAKFTQGNEMALLGGTLMVNNFEKNPNIPATFNLLTR